MKIRNLSLSLSVILTLSIIFGGCEKQELITSEFSNEINTTEIKVSDLPELEVFEGMIHFEDAEQFLATIDLLSNASSGVVKEWENKIGFKSISTIQDEALDELNELTTEKELNEWLIEYEDFFELIINNEGEQEITNLIQDKGYARICNSNQLYTVANNAYLVRNDELIIAPITKQN